MPAVPAYRSFDYHKVSPSLNMHTSAAPAVHGIWPVTPLPGLRVKLFADTADMDTVLNLSSNPWVQGFTTNPTLMRQAGVSDYPAFAKQILSAISDRPVSFEIIADEFSEMERQARLISEWGSNVYVKIPITNTRGESSCALLQRLSREGLKLNVTGLLTLDQVCRSCEALAEGPSSYISVFAGRIADTGRDPMPIMSAAIDLLRAHAQLELIWASPRELLNIYQADAVGCSIITATSEILRKLPLIGRDLAAYSLETVTMFFDDARASGFVL